MFTTSHGANIHYIDEGEGPPVVLIHGFAASLDLNWRAPGIIEALRGAGRRVIALDCRGHGKSARPHDASEYSGSRMTDDVLAVMDACGVRQADLVGYSMGAALSARFMTLHPDRLRSVVLGGMGNRLARGGFDPERAAAVAHAMQASSSTEARTEIARGFRIFAERTGNDLAALAALQQSAASRRLEPGKLRDVRLPVLVVVGEDDTLVGPADELAGAIPGAELRVVPGDHLTAVGKPEFRDAIIDFLATHSSVGQAERS
jgi:pimeloyl-ACP methyl ester carboxylesterase